ncbi:hypothetical protein BJ170DRAFT_252444 [Xylariales sp. AK1849]|nr:hypothetical protein BJ170DRAFT_252444 [Xylariales sp. AK1849]
MSGFYQQQYLPGATGSGEETSPGPQDAQPYGHTSAMQPGSSDQPMINPYESLGYYAGFPDPIMFQPPKPQSARSRRKSAPGLDHVKHRRTRSGCFTCRSRRVKCDETHPICERCRKGKRECVYPEPSASKGSAGSTSSKEGAATNLEESAGSSPEDLEDEVERDTKLESIPDEEEPEGSSPQQYVTSLRRGSAASNFYTRKTSIRHGSETPSLEGNKSSSPSTGTSTGFLTPFHASDPSIRPGPLDWSNLAPDLRFYLDYYYDNLTYYNYCMIQDPEDFFRTFLPSTAIRNGNEALLYAVVGFSAYHYTLQNPKGKIQDFLQYYNKSVTLLLNSFKRKEKQNTATLLTILQLATIEEYLGDWVNLMGHQKAALQILIQLFTPQTAMQSSVTRMFLTWYVRFDVFVGMLGGFETRLPREWFSTTVEHGQGQLAQEPESLSWKLEVSSAAIRLITVDMALLYAQAGRGEVSGELFVAEHGQLTNRLHEWRDNLDPALTDSNYRVTDFNYRRPLGEDDIVDPYAEGSLYEPPLFATTILLCEWQSILVMHKSQEPMTLQQEPTAELRDLVLRICQIFETVERWPFSPNGAVVILQSCLGIATLFTPRDQKHDMWMRRKFASIETLGYVFPLTMRTRMAEIFRDPTCIHWWLPEEEGLTPILRSIRAFADERNGNPVSQQTESLREMSAIFAKMRLDPKHEETPSPLEPPANNPLQGKGKNVRS